MIPLEHLLTEIEVSHLLGRAFTILQKDRLHGDGPPYIKLGRLVRYSPSTVQKYIDERTRQSTSEGAREA
jgi:hypothetical protein